jgi:hypothetical protein
VLTALEFATKLNREIGDRHEAGSQIAVLVVAGGERAIDLERFRQAGLEAQRDSERGRR